MARGMENRSLLAWSGRNGLGSCTVSHALLEFTPAGVKIHGGSIQGWGQCFGDYGVNRQLPSAGEFPRLVQTASPLKGWGITRLAQESWIMG
jgi:hypothetical protein